MINIEKFVQTRKKLRLSQTELCRGICTQSTLSKFENNGQVPSFKILKQLCERMDIDVSDIMDTVSTNISRISCLKRILPLSILITVKFLLYFHKSTPK